MTKKTHDCRISFRAADQFVQAAHEAARAKGMSLAEFLRASLRMAIQPEPEMVVHLSGGQSDIAAWLVKNGKAVAAAVSESPRP